MLRQPSADARRIHEGRPALTIAAAQRAGEALLAFAIVQQAIEHLAVRSRERWLFVLQILLGGAMGAGVAPAFVEGALLVVSVELIRRFQGPYNGGSDRLRLLVLACVGVSHLVPGDEMPRVALGYLAVQVVLSYGMAGWVKLLNPDWRSGHALRDVLEFSVYPVSRALRAWASAVPTLRALSWTVIAFELAFPLALLHPTALRGALLIALAFHLGNACAFGLNRFVWAWLASYPFLLWFQQEVIAPLL